MSQIGEERKKIILDLLNLEGIVRSSELSEKLRVSGEMVRRYLDELERKQQLKRIYGGAIKIVARDEQPYMSREIERVEAKKKIGSATAKLIEDEDVIFVDDGTTAVQIISHLHEKQNVTLVVHSFDLLQLLMDHQKKGLFTGQIYLLGGRVSTKYSRVVGGFAESMAEKFNVDKALISVDGITIDHGITGFDLERGFLIRKIASNALQTIIMMDHSKIGHRYHYKILGLEDMDIIVSDVASPSQWQATLQSKNIEWINAQDEIV